MTALRIVLFPALNHGTEVAIAGRMEYNPSSFWLAVFFFGLPLNVRAVHGPSPPWAVFGPAFTPGWPGRSDHSSFSPGPFTGLLQGL